MFNPQDIDSIISGYEQIGLFSHLSEEEINKGKRKATTVKILSYQRLLMCFPKVVLSYDTESGNLDNPYEELTQQLAIISRGAFTPFDVQDTFGENLDQQKETLHYSFRLNDKLYQMTLRVMHDWLDPAFYDLIERALKENRIDGRFYTLPGGGQETADIFLTAHQYAYLHEKQPELFIDSDTPGVYTDDELSDFEDFDEFDTEDDFDFDKYFNADDED